MNNVYMKAAAEMSADDVKQMQEYIAANCDDSIAPKAVKVSNGNDVGKSVKRYGLEACTNATKEAAADVASDAINRHAPDSTVEVFANTASSTGRTRRKQSHSWPDIGTVLHAEYYGQRYRATIIKATKKLLSGRQVKIQNGPAAEEVCDSLSAAMLKATESQRMRMGLRRKGVANGWDFWQWVGK